MNMGTDIKRTAYILPKGETAVPTGVQHAWDEGLRARQILRDSIKVGQTAGQTNEIMFKNKYKKLLKDYDRILVEEYIPGREIQVAVMGDKALGAIELVPKRQFYDYKAKYSSKACTKHIMPAPISSNKYEEVLNLAKKAHSVLGCRGITRSDFRFFRDQFYLLELNTQPGMTKLSLVPEIAAYSGMSFINLIEWIIKDASIYR